MGVSFDELTGSAPGPETTAPAAGGGISFDDLATETASSQVFLPAAVPPTTGDPYAQSQSNFKNRVFGTIDLVADWFVLLRGIQRAAGRSHHEGASLPAPDVDYGGTGPHGIAAKVARVLGADVPKTPFDRVIMESQKNAINTVPAAAGLTVAGMGVPGAVAATALEAGAVTSPFLKYDWLLRKLREMPNPTEEDIKNLVFKADMTELAATLASGVAIPVTAQKVAKAQEVAALEKKIASMGEDELDELNRAYVLLKENLKLRFGKNAPEITRADVLSLGGDWKRFFRPSPFTPSVNPLDEALPYWDKAAAKYPQGAGPTTVQAVPTYLSRELLNSQDEAMAKMGNMGQDYVLFKEAQNQAFLTSIYDNLRKEAPDATMDDAMAIASGISKKLKAEAGPLYDRRIYDGVVDTKKYKDQILELAQEADIATYFPKDLFNKLRPTIDPKTGKLLFRKISPQELDILRSDASALANSANWNIEGGDRMTHYGHRILDLIDDMWDDLPEGTNETAKAARAAWAKYKSFTSTKTPGGDVVKLMLDRLGKTTEPALADTIMRTESNMARAIEAVNGDPKGIAALQRVTLNKIFGIRFDEEIGRAIQSPDKQLVTQSLGAIYTNLNKNKDALKLLFGEDKFKFYVELTDSLVEASRTRTGTLGAVRGTGSFNWQSHIERGVQAARDIRSPIALAQKAVQAELEAIQSDPVRIALLQDVMLHPKTAAALSRVPTKASLPAYLLTWKQTIARASMAAAGKQVTDADFDEAEAVLSQQLGVPPNRVPEEAVIKYLLDRGPR